MILYFEIFLFLEKNAPLLMQGGAGLSIDIILWLRRSSFWQTERTGQRNGAGIFGRIFIASARGSARVHSSA